MEDAKFIWKLEQEIEYFKANQQIDIIRIDDFEIHTLKIVEDFAYIVYELWSEMEKENVVKKFHWVESAVFRKVNEKWKIELIHSTKFDD